MPIAPAASGRRLFFHLLVLSSFVETTNPSSSQASQEEALMARSLQHARQPGTTGHQQPSQLFHFVHPSHGALGAYARATTERPLVIQTILDQFGECISYYVPRYFCGRTTAKIRSTIGLDHQKRKEKKKAVISEHNGKTDRRRPLSNPGERWLRLKFSMDNGCWAEEQLGGFKVVQPWFTSHQQSKFPP